MTSTTARLSVAAAAVTALLTATGCLTSPRSDFHTFTSGDGTIRCASAVASVAEYEDRGDDGTYPAAAVTAANRDLYCVHDDTVGPAWSSLRSQARLVVYVGDQVQVCALAPTAYASGADHLALSAKSGRCGSNRRYYTAGTHDAYTSGGQHHIEWTFSPEIVLP
jgi:hypothetical protein